MTKFQKEIMDKFPNLEFGIDTHYKCLNFAWGDFAEIIQIKEDNSIRYFGVGVESCDLSKEKCFKILKTHHLLSNFQ